MTTLQEALQASSWRLLLIIGRQRGLGLDANLSKPDLIDKIIPVLLDLANLNRLLPHLSPLARQALADLQQAGGQVPARYLRQQYGQLRPMSHLVQQYRQLPAPVDLAAFAPLEQLCLVGLTFLARTTDELFIPLEVRAYLKDEPAGRMNDESGINSPDPSFILHRSSFPLLPSPADLLCHDLTCLLALLQRDDVLPLHQRWLPPAFLKRWGQLCLAPPLFPHARSELQTERRRFLHYLAESAGFVSSPWSLVISQTQDKSQRTNDKGQGTVLKPTPAAWLWLQSPYAQRLQSLWQTWTKPDPEQWRLFRLPGHDWLTDPAPLLARLHPALLELEPADPARFAEILLKRQPDLRELVPISFLEPLELLKETIVQLLTGPLVWLGALNDQLIMRNEQLSLSPSPTTALKTGLQLTAHGLAWLNDTPLPDPPPAAKFAVSADIQADPLQSRLILTPGPGLPDPADLMVAVELNDEFRMMNDESEDSTKYSSFILHPSAFVRALHRGWAAVALVDALNRLAERPLHSQETALLRAWAEMADRMTIRHAAILETDDPEIIRRLASTRRGRTLIWRTLSPRAVIVDPAKVALLIRRLTEQEGVPPKDELGRMKDESGINSPDSSFIVHPSSFLWLALKVYQGLGQHIPLPARIPQAVLDQVAAAAGPETLAAADIAAEQTLAALGQALDGYTAFPPWPEAGLPIEASLPIIEQALAAGQNLELLYYTAGTGRLARRVVEPYRVEWRANTAYLIGFCHRAEAERVFRLDRIREIGLKDSDKDKDKDWV